MSELVNIKITAPTPLLVTAAAEAFARLRDIVFEGSGVDFLARCGDVFRPAGFRSTKDGVADRSWHKTGRAIDYDQESRSLVIVSDPSGGKQFFRTYLRCSDQSGTLGVKRRVHDIRRTTIDAFLFDFTAAAERLGFKRIPAWNGWQTRYNRREFWHYQYNPDALTWDAAMLQLRGKVRPAAATVYGLNDRGETVRQIQTALNAAGLLPAGEIDGVYGKHTRNAVAAFQRSKKLAPDGLAGPDTLKQLGL